MIKNIIKNNDYEIIIKNSFIHIKNYINILDISNTKISILLNQNKLIINGSSLLITALDQYELIIKGNIKGIELNDR